MGDTGLLRADGSAEARVSQVAFALDTYLLLVNGTGAAATCPAGAKCIRSGESITVGIGVSETEVSVRLSECEARDLPSLSHAYVPCRVSPSFDRSWWTL